MGTARLSLENSLPLPAPPRSLRFQGSRFTYHLDSADTGGQLALLEVEAAPGSEPPLHVHRNEDELFFVLEGELKVWLGDEEITLKSGQSGFLPRGVPHTFKIVSKSARALVYITPGGFEHFFRDLGTPFGPEDVDEVRERIEIPRMIRVASRYGITFMP